MTEQQNKPGGNIPVITAEREARATPIKQGVTRKSLQDAVDGNRNREITPAVKMRAQKGWQGALASLGIPIGPGPKEMEEIQRRAKFKEDMTRLHNGIRRKIVNIHGFNPVITVASEKGGIGKALALNTSVPTVNGWTQIEDIQIGDTLLGRNGEPTKVTAIFNHDDLVMYDVKLSDGQVFRACEDHRWVVTRTNSDKEEVLTTAELITAGVNTVKENGKAHSNFAILSTKPINLKEKDLPVSPRVLAEWLFDDITNNEIVKDIQVELKELNVLENKQIPEEYLRASYEQRSLLFNEIIRINGLTEEDTGALSLQESALATSLVELSRSLGIITKVSTRTENGAENWVITLNLPSDEDTHKWNYITDITSVENEPGKCLTVDAPDHVFLIGGFVPTHNSTTSILLGWALAEPGKQSVAICEVNPHLGSLAAKVGTPQSPCLRDFLIEGRRLGIEDKKKEGVFIRADEDYFAPPPYLKPYLHTVDGYNLNVLSGNTSPSRRYPTQLMDVRRLVFSVSQKYDATILDNGTDMDDSGAFEGSLRSSNCFVLVTNSDYQQSKFVINHTLSRLKSKEEQSRKAEVKRRYGLMRSTAILAIVEQTKPDRLIPYEGQVGSKGAIELLEHFKSHFIDIVIIPYDEEVCSAPIDFKKLKSETKVAATKLAAASWKQAARNMDIN